MLKKSEGGSDKRFKYALLSAVLLVFIALGTFILISQLNNFKPQYLYVGKRKDIYLCLKDKYKEEFVVNKVKVDRKWGDPTSWDSKAYPVAYPGMKFFVQTWKGGTCEDDYLTARWTYQQQSEFDKLTTGLKTTQAKYELTVGPRVQNIFESDDIGEVIIYDDPFKFKNYNVAAVEAPKDVSYTVVARVSKLYEEADRQTYIKDIKKIADYLSDKNIGDLSMNYLINNSSPNEYECRLYEEDFKNEITEEYIDSKLKPVRINGIPQFNGVSQ